MNKETARVCNKYLQDTSRNVTEEERYYGGGGSIMVGHKHRRAKYGSRWGIRADMEEGKTGDWKGKYIRRCGI